MWKLALTLTICLFACGCRCRSDLAPPEGAGSGVVSDSVPVTRWCKACALKNFLSCQRVTAAGTEAEVRRMAELAACKDIGFTPEQCTPERIRFSECGVVSNK
jgi:hypothetical protein